MHITNIPKLPRVAIVIPTDRLAWLLAAIYAALALIVIASSALAGEQTRFYDSHGNSVGTATRDSQGTTVFRDSRGNTVGSSSRPRR
jgi:hypothetical protein